MAEERTTSSTGGQKGVKIQAFNKIPTLGLLELGRLYGVGARKYDDHNFRLGYEWSKSFASLMRHSSLFWSGENIDSELNTNHMSSVAWHAVTLTEFYYTFQSFDDRPTAPNHVVHDFIVERASRRSFPAKHVDRAIRADGDIEPRIDLLPLRPLSDLAKFYGENIAEPVAAEGRAWSDEYAKLQEYALRFWSGENFSASSGHLNTIHVMHHALNLIELTERFPEYDDRFISGAAPIGFDSLPPVK